MRSSEEQSSGLSTGAVAVKRLAAMDLIGKVLRIEKTSIHDGEGLRTVVFLKGCPLSCKWCSTPESQYQYAHCATGYGKDMTVSQVVKEICKDEIFFFHSGGGVTISGGEVLMQSRFAEELLKACTEEGIPTSIETSLYADYETAIGPLLPYLPSMYVDFKIFDEKKHISYTGVSNQKIKDNLRRLQREYAGKVHVRIPTVPGINMDAENMKQTALFIKDMSVVSDLELLPYHRLGLETYRKLKVSYGLPDVHVPEMEELNRMADAIHEVDKDRTVLIKGQKREFREEVKESGLYR